LARIPKYRNVSHRAKLSAKLQSTGGNLEKQPGWFALTAKHQHEPTVARLLGGKGIEVFHPTYAAVRQWKDRKKTVQLPLFPGYVFFTGGLDRRVEILSTPGVFSIVSFGDSAAEISGEEMEGIRRAVAGSMPIQPHPFLAEGERVRVTRGVLAGVNGMLLRRKDAYRLVLSIELLGRSAAVEIDTEMVERIPTSQHRSGYEPWTEQVLNLSN
jgi:transcription termination/antitermination protein NusG